MTDLALITQPVDRGNEPANTAAGLRQTALIESFERLMTARVARTGLEAEYRTAVLEDDLPAIPPLKHRLMAAQSDEGQALDGYVRRVGGDVGADLWQVGDRFPSPFTGATMIVASKMVPPHALELSEMTATTDGLYVENGFHNWDLNDEGQPILLLDGEAIYYERWHIDGLRVSGAIHPHSRRVVDTYVV